MVQESVYCKLVLNHSIMNSVKKRVRKCSQRDWCSYCVLLKSIMHQLNISLEVKLTKK